MTVSVSTTCGSTTSIRSAVVTVAVSQGTPSTATAEPLREIVARSPSPTVTVATAVTSSKVQWLAGAARATAEIVSVRSIETPRTGPSRRT
jgi:hypothetical protein